MEGFGQRDNSGIWCRIAKGKIIVNAQPGAPGAQKLEKVDKDGKVQTDDAGNPIHIWRFIHDKVGGRIIKLTDKVDTFENISTKKLVITLAVTGQPNINLDLKYGDRYWMGMCNSLMNVDLRKPVTFEPYDYIHKVTRKPTTGMSLLQDGKKLEWMFTKAEPNGMPPLDKVYLADGSVLQINGRDQWNWKPIHDFLHKNVVEEVRKRLAEIVPQEASAEQRPVENQAEVYGGATSAAVVDSDPFDGGAHMDDDDELPF